MHNIILFYKYVIQDEFSAIPEYIRAKKKREKDNCSSDVSSIQTKEADKAKLDYLYKQGAF